MRNWYYIQAKPLFWRSQNCFWFFSFFFGSRSQAYFMRLWRPLFWLVGLEFDFWWGACTNMGDRSIYLCFDQSWSKECHKSTSPTGQYDRTNQTTHEHRYTRIASSSRKIKSFLLLDFLFILCSGSILALGSDLPGNKKTELFVSTKNVWLQLEDYPFE